jgi:hypothetical protein
MVLERIVRRNGFARCPFSAAVERADGALRAAHFSVLIVNDFTDTVRRHEAVEFRWTPPLHVFPAAQALLTVRPHAPEGTELQLSLAYVPPMRSFGAVFDRMIGRHIAWFTVGTLIHQLQRAIHNEHQN